MTHFINGIGLITVNHPNLKRISDLLNDRAFIYVNNVLDGQRYLDAVAIIVGSKYDFLKCFNPFLGTSSTVCLEMVHPLMSDDGEVSALPAFVFSLRSRDAVPQVDVPTWKVNIGRIGIVRKYVSFQSEPVAIEPWALSASL